MKHAREKTKRIEPDKSYQGKGLSFIQNAEYDILEHVVQLCEKHQIEYYAVCGTLLGAVRHGGFIPWDDDVDIVIPRPQYDMFIDLARKELTDPFKIQTFDHRLKTQQTYFAKIINKNVQVKYIHTDYDCHTSVWLDVFPLDGAPKKYILFLIWRSHCIFLYKLFTLTQIKYKYKRSITNLKRKSKSDILMHFLLWTRIDYLFSEEKVWKRLDKKMRRYDYSNTPFVINICSAWRKKELFPKEYYGNGTKLSFEGLDIQVPKEYTRVLKQIYGDYKQLPPQEKRNHHSIEYYNCDEYIKWNENGE